MRDLRSRIGVVQMLAPVDTADTDTSSSILDLKGFASAVLCLSVGVITGVDATNYLTPVLQESASTADADFTDVAADDILGAFTKIDATTEDVVNQCVGYRGTKRYVRVKLDYTGAGITAALIAINGIVGHAGKEPVTAPAALAAT